MISWSTQGHDLGEASKAVSSKQNLRGGGNQENSGLWIHNVQMQYFNTSKSKSQTQTHKEQKIKMVNFDRRVIAGFHHPRLHVAR